MEKTKKEVEPKKEEIKPEKKIIINLIVVAITIIIAQRNNYQNKVFIQAAFSKGIRKGSLASYFLLQI